MTDVEILSIGDELLRGIVHESNAYRLAKRSSARGAMLRRVTMLPDDPAVVAAEIRAALERVPRVLVTHGGLGPTEDDRTREAIATATGRPLTRHPDAEAIVRRRYQELASAGVVDPDENDARLRMADLPMGAHAVDNQVGTAPAFVLDLGATTLIALPGVPREVEWIWDEPLAPLLDELIGPGGFAERTFVTTIHDESGIAPILERVQAGHDGVYVKSRARGFGAGDQLRITLHAIGAGEEEARASVAAAEADLRAALEAEGLRLGDPQ